MSILQKNAGGTQYKSQNVASNPLVVFTTMPVTVSLKDSTGAGLGGGVISYAQGTWLSFGTTGSDGLATRELLPGSYKFKLSYAGGSLEKPPRT